MLVAASCVPVAVVLVVWTSGLDETPMRGATAGSPRIAAQIARGKALYALHCASCHGPELEGQADWKHRLPDGRYPAPPHDETGHTWHHGDDLLFRTTKRGGQATAPPGYVSGMPAFESTLTDDEILRILDFIKSRWPADIAASQAARNR